MDIFQKRASLSIFAQQLGRFQELAEVFDGLIVARLANSIALLNTFLWAVYFYQKLIDCEGMRACRDSTVPPLPLV